MILGGAPQPATSVTDSCHGTTCSRASEAQGTSEFTPTILPTPLTCVLDPMRRSHQHRMAVIKSKKTTIIHNGRHWHRPSGMHLRANRICFPFLHRCTAHKTIIPWLRIVWVCKCELNIMLLITQWTFCSWCDVPEHYRHNRHNRKQRLVSNICTRFCHRRRHPRCFLLLILLFLSVGCVCWYCSFV